MKKILKNVLLFSALIGSVNCLALPAAAVDVATANTSVMADAADVVYSGTCGAEGDNITWTYNESESTMTFSGTGSMEKYYVSRWDTDGYNNPSIVPEWLTDSRISVYQARTVVFEEGITEVGKMTDDYFGCENSQCFLEVPESVTSLDFSNVTNSLALYGLDGSWFYGFAANHIQRATTAREDTYLLERRRIRYIPQAVLVHLVQHGHLITELVNCISAVLP